MSDTDPGYVNEVTEMAQGVLRVLETVRKDKEVERINSILLSISEIKKLTNDQSRQDEVIEKIEQILKSIPENPGLYLLESNSGECTVNLILGNGQQFEICKFTIWIDDLSGYTESYIYGRVQSGLSNLKSRIEAAHEQAVLKR